MVFCQNRWHVQKQSGHLACDNFHSTLKVEIISYKFIRASDISRKKKQNFAGLSGANSRKNRPISRDFRGKKSKFAAQSADFGRFSRERSQNSRKIGPFRGILAEKSQFSKDFQGQILRKIGRFHGKFRGKLRQETISKNSRFRWGFFGKFGKNRSILR